MNKTRNHIEAFINYKNNRKVGKIIHPTAKEMAIEHSDPKWPSMNDTTKNDWNNLRYGNYYQQILPFYEVFGKEKLIFLDGTFMGMISHGQKENVDPKYIDFLELRMFH